ncbi:MAG: DUF1934 domain-containing protein [Ruminococcaceae bacterium]|nr:DUF1934 domain-containing protein [Oscillospiraceae bacterium]
MKKDINIRIKEIWHNNIDEGLFDVMPSEDEEESADSFLEAIMSGLSDPPGTPQVEFTTCGVMEEQNGGISITYEESELTGMKGAVTQFFIADSGVVTMSRSGANSLNLVFEKDKNYICPNGDEPFLVTTRELKNTISPSGGTLGIAYTINVGGSLTEHNEFNIDIL